MMKKLSIIMCILWMGFIFYNSSQTAQESNERSIKVLNKIKEFKDDTLDMLREIINGNNSSSLNENIIYDDEVIENVGTGISKSGISGNRAVSNREISSKEIRIDREISINRNDIKIFLIRVKNKVEYFVRNNFSNFNVFIRKSAHALEFLVLAILVSWAMFAHGIKGKKASIYILLIVLLYAASDEFHQLFVPGRGASVRDVMIDFFGGIIGLIIFYSGYYGCQYLFFSKKDKLGDKNSKGMKI